MKDCPDRYIVCGKEYIKFREAVTRVTVGEDITGLATTLKVGYELLLNQIETET